MKRYSQHIILNLVTAFAVTLFFSCGNNAEDIQKFNQRSEGPSAEGEGVLLKYTDSGKVVATLKTPLIIEYGLADFPYEEFPKGVEVTFIDDNKNENYITADYAIRYKRSGLIDLRKNVVLITSDSTRLDASQLFWSQKDEWVFTDKPYTIDFPDDSYNKGDLFDSSQDFKNFISLENQSRLYVEDNATEAPKDSIN